MGKRKRQRPPKGDEQPPLDGLVEFVTPTEDPDCFVCRASEPERLLILLSTLDHGATTFRDEHGESHTLVLKAEGEGGIVEYLATTRRLAKEREQENGPSE